MPQARRTSFCAPTEAELRELRSHATEAANLLKALASENRLLIVCTLAVGEMSVGELNARIRISQSGLSQQLAVLRREGLVRARRQSQSIFYSLAPSHAMRVIDVLKELYCGELDRPVGEKRGKKKR